MEQKVLALYDFASKQEFIYRTNKIKEISGASVLLAKLYKKFVELANRKYNIVYDVKTEFEIKKYNADAQVLYDGGGNLMILFQSEKVYFGFNRIVSTYLLEKEGSDSSHDCVLCSVYGRF